MLLVGTLLLGHLSAQSTQPSLPTLQNDLSESYTPRKGWPKADKKFYLDVRGGYSFKMGGGYNGFVRYDDIRTYTGYYRKHKQIKSSLSEGWQGSLNFGYRLNRYMAIEFGVGYTKGDFDASRFFVCDTTGNISLAVQIAEEPTENHLTKFARTSVTIKDDFQSHIGNLSTSVLVSPGFKHWDPYLRMGINIMACVADHNVNVDLGYLIPPMEHLWGEIDESWGGYGRIGHEKIHTLSIGFIGALGVNCKFTPTISMFAEWQFTLMTSRSYRDNWIETTYAWGNEAYSPVLDRAVGRSVRNDFVLPFNNTGLNLGLKFSF